MNSDRRSRAGAGPPVRRETCRRPDRAVGTLGVEHDETEVRGVLHPRETEPGIAHSGDDIAGRIGGVGDGAGHGVDIEPAQRERRVGEVPDPLHRTPV